MPIAREGLREIVVGTLLLGGVAALLGWLYWPLAIPVALVWVWMLTFFRDPKRRGKFAPGELCSAADGRVTEVTELDHYGPIGGPAVRIGVFLSLFNVHVNRSPCSGTVRSISYQPGKFLDARHPESGRLNESNTLLIEPDSPLQGPIEVRQVAGLVARRIICHARVEDHVDLGERFGLIKFGSRTEVVFPRMPGTKIAVKVGDAVRAGVTLLARQPIREVTATAMPTPTTSSTRVSVPARATS